MTGDGLGSPTGGRLRSLTPSLFWTGVLVGCVLALAVVATSAFALSPGVSAADESTAPGESVTVKLSVQDAQTLELSGLPTSWTVESRQDAGAFASGGDSYAGWVWNEDRASETVSVTFRVPADADDGAYDLAVTAEKSDGSTAETSTTVTVDGTAPTADAGSDRTTGVDDALSFDGTASGDDVGVASYEWQFGDGTTATGPTPQHAFADQGTYTVTLTVVDAAGNQDTDTVTVTVDSEQTTTTTATTTTTERSSGGDDGDDDGGGGGDGGGVDDGDDGSGGSSTTATTTTSAMTPTSATETVETTPSTTATTTRSSTVTATSTASATTRTPAGTPSSSRSSTAGGSTAGSSSTARADTASTGTTSSAPASGTSATSDGGKQDSAGSNGFTALAGLVAVTAAALLVRRRNT